MPSLHLLLVHGGGLKRGPDGTWANGVDSDTLLEELVGETSDHGDLSAFGHRVVDKHGWTGVSDCRSVTVAQRIYPRLTLRGSHDDGTALGNVRNSSSRQEECTWISVLGRTKGTKDAP